MDKLNVRLYVAPYFLRNFKWVCVEAHRSFYITLTLDWCILELHGLNAASEVHKQFECRLA